VTQGPESVDPPIIQIGALSLELVVLLLPNHTTSLDSARNFTQPPRKLNL
jgi:hypothetical protein